ncbi:MAG: hypothetical protein JWM49_893 [Microbacteriaceae bacterium]|nr:hypothetical protein [Microbacteriaceae bacterium]
MCTAIIKLMSNSQQPTIVPPASTGTYGAETPKKGNGLGVASLVIGIIAFVGSFIPFLNFGTGFIAFVALVLGVIGLILKGRPRRATIAGAIISVVALVLSIVLSIAYTAAFAGAVNDSIKKSDAAANKTVSLVYDITGDSSDATVSYSTYTDGKSGTAESTGQTLPFTKTLDVKQGGTFSFNSFLLTGSNGATGTTISCKITLDGKVIAEQTSTGQYTTVSCSGTGTK